MTTIPASFPLPAPPVRTASPETVNVGLPIPPIERIRIMSDRQWEEFVLEWADSLRTRYARVDRCGGAGDMGRDVIAIGMEGDGIWDNYQCKFYKDPLTPDDVWLEFGKVVYYTSLGVFTCPRKYVFVSPCGVGTKLSNLLRRPDEIKKGLIMQWDAKCSNGITSTKEVKLIGSLQKHLEAFDCSIFDSLPPLRLIDEHAKTRWHVARFGGGLPARQAVALPPVTPTPGEAGYVRCLLDAYGDHLRRAIAAPSDLDAENILKEHFGDSRVEFYSAESLRSFSRDTLPPGEFEKLQEEVLGGIRDEIRADHPSGYARVLAVVKAARSLQLSGHALNTRIAVRDRGGICHQLANDKKARWTR